MNQLYVSLAFWQLKAANFPRQILNLVLPLMIVGRRSYLPSLVVFGEAMQAEVAEGRESIGEDAFLVVQCNAAQLDDTVELLLAMEEVLVRDKRLSPAWIEVKLLACFVRKSDVALVFTTPVALLMYNERLDQGHDRFEEWVHQKKLAASAHVLLHLVVEVCAGLMT